jgi:hypothetical protein
MKKILVLLVFACFAAGPVFSQADFLPEIKRVAVFKNGYAFTYREAETKTRNGWVYTGSFPIGVLGTIWGYSTSPNVRVTELRTSEMEKQETMRVANLTEFLLANEGAQIRAEVLSGDAKIKVFQGVYEVISPMRGFKFPKIPAIVNGNYEIADNRNTNDMAIAIKTEAGTLVFSASRIENVEIIGQSKWHKPIFSKQNRLGIRTEGAADGQPVNLGIAALERGIRWIPAYRVEVKGSPIKEAKLELEANLINELTDLKDTEMYFVVGVPHFLFQDTMSPLSMNAAFAGVSGYFNTSGNDRNLNITARQMSNSSVDGSSGEDNTTPSPTIVNDEQLRSFSAEQLFLYQANSITLKKGERSSLRLFSLTVPCSEVFEWTVNDAPDTQRRYLDYSNNSQPLMQDLSTKVWYALRLKNPTGMPWTTAPAITFREWKPIGQDMLTFTPIGGDNVLRVTPATEVIGSQTLEEKSRERVQMNYGGSSYNFDLVTVEGRLKLRNVKSEPVEVLLTRNLVGEVISAGDDGKISRDGINLQMVNPNSVVKWKLVLPTGEKEITYVYKVYIRR